MKSPLPPPVALAVALLGATVGLRLTVTQAAHPARATHLALAPGAVLASVEKPAHRAPAGPVAGVLVAAAGDIACDPNDPNFAGGKGRRGECKQQFTARAILDRNPAAVLVLGDTQYDDGKRGKYLRSYDRSWGKFRDITYPAIGNHEYYTPRADGYFDYFKRRAGERGKAYYSFGVGTWHVVALNSNCDIVRCSVGSAQYRWLADDLAANRTTCTLAYMHHPRFSSGPHGDYKAVLPLWRLLYRAGADLVLAGHDHTYERFAPQRPDGRADRANGIREFVVGTGGAETYWFESRDRQTERRAADTLGVLFLRLGDGEYGWRFLRVAGERFSDSGSGVCH